MPYITRRPTGSRLGQRFIQRLAPQPDRDQTPLLTPQNIARNGGIPSTGLGALTALNRSPLSGAKGPMTTPQRPLANIAVPRMSLQSSDESGGSIFDRLGQLPQPGPPPPNPIGPQGQTPAPVPPPTPAPEPTPAPASGLPLSPEFEAARRVLEDELAAALASINVSRAEIPALVQLVTQRLLNEQIEAERQSDESVNERGLFNSGIRTTNLERTRVPFDRARQDFAMDIAGQLRELATGESTAQLGYQRGLSELLLQIAQDAAQDETTPVGGGGGGGAGGGATTTLPPPYDFTTGLKGPYGGPISPPPGTPVLPDVPKSFYQKKRKKKGGG